MHCWKRQPVRKSFDQCSFECVDFHRMTQIFASLTPERITIPPETNSNDLSFCLELISRFEFDFSVSEIICERIDLCSKFNHKQCGRTCACSGASFYQHNSTSNVLASVTIHDDSFLITYFQELTEHHGKCRTCESFVIICLCLSLCFCLSVSESSTDTATSPHFTPARRCADHFTL